MFAAVPLQMGAPMAFVNNPYWNTSFPVLNSFFNLTAKGCVCPITASEVAENQKVRSMSNRFSQHSTSRCDFRFTGCACSPDELPRKDKFVAGKRNHRGWLIERQFCGCVCNHNLTRNRAN